MITETTGTFIPLRDGILVSNMEFGEQRTEGGIIILSDDGKSTGIHPRWGKVLAIGKDQKDVKIGQYVLVAHGRWSRGFKLIGETVRTIDPEDVLGIQNDEPQSIYKASAGHQTQEYQGKVSVGKLEV